MSVLTRVLSSIFDEKHRVIKVLRFGKGDAQTADEAGPYGLDSSPISDMVAVFSDTAVKGDSVIVGYLNKNQVANPGEFRTYSTDDDGNVKFYTWLKKDGTMEIGGDADNMVRYSKLEAAFNELKSDFNSLVLAFNSHMHATAGAGAPSPPTPVPDQIPAVPTQANILPAKIIEIKTI